MDPRNDPEYDCWIFTTPHLQNTHLNITPSLLIWTHVVMPLIIILQLKKRIKSAGFLTDKTQSHKHIMKRSVQNRDISPICRFYSFEPPQPYLPCLCHPSSCLDQCFFAHNHTLPKHFTPLRIQNSAVLRSSCCCWMSRLKGYCLPTSADMALEV